jgi:hypothetical protein
MLREIFSHSVDITSYFSIRQPSSHARKKCKADNDSTSGNVKIAITQIIHQLPHDISRSPWFELFVISISPPVVL